MMKWTTPAEWARHRTSAQWAEHHLKVVLLLVGLALICSYPMGVFVLAMLTAPHPTPASSPAAAAIEGSGIVISMNDGLNAITVQHTGIPALNLAPGTTSFRAAEPIFKRTEVGDQLNFRLTKQDGVYVITSMQNSVTGTQTAPHG